MRIAYFDKIAKKVRKLALAQTISKKNLDKKLHILADVKKEVKKTKEFNKFFNKMIKCGVYFPPSAYETSFVSGSHADHEFDKTIKAMEKC